MPDKPDKSEKSKPLFKLVGDLKAHFDNGNFNDRMAVIGATMFLTDTMLESMRATLSNAVQAHKGGRTN